MKLDPRAHHQADPGQQAFAREARRINAQGELAKQGREADRRRERVENWTCAAYFALGAWLMWLAVWSKGGVPWQP